MAGENWRVAVWTVVGREEEGAFMIQRIKKVIGVAALLVLGAAVDVFLFFTDYPQNLAASTIDTQLNILQNGNNFAR
jgi:hypothetical protein